MAKIRIEQEHPRTSSWQSIPFHKIAYDDEYIVVRGHFRIVLDGEVIYESEKNL